MAEGVIKWFDNRKGWGFISDPAGDIFVHFSEINGEGFRRLKEGDRVSYELIKSDKGLKACKVEKLDSVTH